MNENKYPNLDYPNNLVPYEGKLMDHPYVKVIDDLIGLNETQTEEIRHEGVNCVSWRHSIAPGLIYWVTIDLHQFGKVGIDMTVAFGLIPKENEDLIAVGLLSESQHLRMPIRYSILMQNIAAVQFDSLEHWLTEEHLKHRFESVLEFSRYAYDKWVRNGELKMKPLPKGWFDFKIRAA